MPDRYRNVIIIALAALLAAAVVALVLNGRSGPQPLEIDLASLTPTPGGPIEVYITGAVVQPGVYEMKDGDRVVDLLYEAGGHAPDADLNAVNLALRLHDEDQVVVPRAGETPPGFSSGLTSGVAGVTTARVNINTATASELDDLPGIGEVYSERIVESRTWDGPFMATEELLERRIIPRATYERIQELITVGP